MFEFFFLHNFKRVLIRRKKIIHISITYIRYIVYSYHLISLPVRCQVPTLNLSESQCAPKGLLTPAGGKAVRLVAARDTLFVQSRPVREAAIFMFHRFEEYFRFC